MSVAHPKTEPNTSSNKLTWPRTLLRTPPMSEEKRDVRNPLLFECAWEVANKVGGIYTVIKTKVPVTVSEYGDRYCLIGPLSYKTAPMEVEPEEPTDPHLATTLQSLRAQGVKILYGRWLIEGAPHVLLFDTGSQYARLDEWKGDLWNLAGIPSPPNDHETNEAIIFGYLVAWFLGHVRVRHDYFFATLIFYVLCFLGISMSLCSSTRLWSPISTNGRQDSPFRCVASGTLMLRRSLLPMRPFSVAISAPGASTFTTICSTLTSITRRANGAFITDTASNGPPLIVQTSSPPSLISPLTSLNIY